MPDHWSFVIAAYGLAAVVLASYWRFLRRRDRELRDLEKPGAAGSASTRP